MSIVTRTLLAFALGAPLIAAAAAGTPTTLPLPEDWYPESLAAAPDGSLYVGSWRQGAVARLRPGQPPQVLVAPGSNGLANGQGVLIDAARQQLWICSGTMGFITVPMTASALKRYDLRSGAPTGSYLLPEAGYCNDLAQTADGAIYVTDSKHPRVLRLRPGESQLGVWLDDPTIAAGPEGFYFNGIAGDGAHGFYLSRMQAVDYLLHVDIAGNGSAGPTTQLKMPRVLKNADGLRSAGAGRLLIFESNAFGEGGPYGGQISLARIAGDRHVTQLEVLVAGLNDPSGGAIANGRVYFIQSKYGLLFAHKDDDASVPRHVPFAVESVALPR